MKSKQKVIDVATREETDFNVDPESRYRTSSFNLRDSWGGVFPWHWHAEVEYFYARKGSFIYHLPGGEYLFSEGDVGFVNSGVLHMTTVPEAEEGWIQNHIFLPRLISGGSAMTEERYIAPLVNNSAAQLMRFESQSVEAASIRRWMDEAWAAHKEERFAHELIVRDCMSRIWTTFAEHMPENIDREWSRDSRRLTAMVRYIEIHYAEKIELQALADAAHISGKECERCFRRQIHMTPFDYIRDYRLEKARGMLRQAWEISITEIGRSCGFVTTSYFGKCFRQKYGVSPREYRESWYKSE